MRPGDRLDSIGTARTSPLDGAARAYRAAYGDPGAQTGFDDVPRRPRRVRPRLGMDLRTAVSAGLAVLILAVGVLLLDPGRAEQVPLGEVRSLPRASQDAGVDEQDAVAAGEDGSPPAGRVSESAPAAPGDDQPVPTSSPRPGLVVHVVGEVAEPGLVDLAAGMRVADAIAAAGGPTSTADLAALNLAREIADGEQIYVPAPGEEVPVASGADPGSSAEAGRPALVNVNTADAGALEGLPGVGPVLAARIVGHREDHGPFASVDELVEVSGIGDAVLEGLRDLATT
ncbi:competence protein ComEA [Paraoerskovia marina]|uniref:Competence protein ComEA n=1 Tax=Paraoerskovia marina TaxID=545619 RepID=A0A1H1RTB2_9CELL|nr:helix-hairpin-helix domain-containing protein [Paraoerskovia marina]SDS38924.1 competence protein ComEA [Paraoerskovia marina]